MSLIRILTEADAGAYREMRIRSLREHPEAYVMSAEEAAQISVEDYGKRLAKPLSDSANWGAFLDEQPVGITSMYRPDREKANQRAYIVGVYVAPEARGKGLARQLLEAALAHARTLAGVLDVVLAVTVGNAIARKLYLNAGFQAYAVDPRYIRVGDVYHDIEWMILQLKNSDKDNQ